MAVFLVSLLFDLVLISVELSVPHHCRRSFAMEGENKKSSRRALHPAAWGSFGRTAFQAFQIFNMKNTQKQRVGWGVILGGSGGKALYYLSLQ